MRIWENFCNFAPMNFEYYVAKRLIKHKDKNFTRPIIRIAQITIMLSVAVMLISVSVLQGFKKEIKSKIAGFSSHIQITQYSTNAVLEDNSLMSLSSLEKQQILNNKNVKTLYPVFSRGGVLINKEDFQGVICKGVDSSYDKTFFTDNIVEGKFPSLNKESKQEILVSKTIKDKLKIKLNDKIKIYFYVNNSYRAKNFYVSGVYDTGLGEYDENFLVCDMSVLKNIFSVEDDMFSCYEVMLKDFSSLRKASQEIYYTIGQDKSIMPITDLEPNLFSWLNLLDSNVVMIILVMILVSVVTLSSIMLIMIFEKKKMIGVLKSFGTKNASIIKIFLYKIGYVILYGILLGNVFAIGLELIQKYFHIISLDKASYYLSTVPININILHILLINMGVFVVCLICLLLPARSINKIDPVKNLSFD